MSVDASPAAAPAPLPPFPSPIEGVRVLLRCYTVEDAPVLKEAVDETREALLRWMPWGQDHRTIEQSVAFCGRSYGRFHAREDFILAIFEKASRRFLGGTGLHVKNAPARAFELGYWIRASAEGKGYVQEAARLVTAAGFESMGANRVMVRCDTANERSRRVIARAGFPLEGTARRESVRSDGTLSDVVSYAMVREDYEAARARWREEAGRASGGSS